MQIDLCMEIQYSIFKHATIGVWAFSWEATTFTDFLNPSEKRPNLGKGLEESGSGNYWLQIKKHRYAPAPLLHPSADHQPVQTLHIPHRGLCVNKSEFMKTPSSMCPVSGQSRVMAAIVLTSQASDGLEQFPKDPWPRITFLQEN